MRNDLISEVWGELFWSKSTKQRHSTHGPENRNYGQKSGKTANEFQIVGSTPIFGPFWKIFRKVQENYLCFHNQKTCQARVLTKV